MKRIVYIALVATLLFLWSQSLPKTSAASPTAATPNLIYLGESAGTYEAGPNGSFIVKRLHPFRFDFVPGPEYTSPGDERIWAISGHDQAPPADYHNYHSFGFLEQGCVIDYTGIDDDVNGKINHFFVNDELVHTINEGMVFGGRFVMPKSGELSLYANDSVGIWTTLCDSQETPTPTPTLEATATATLEPTATATATLEPTLEPTVTNTPDPEQTPTVTPEVTETPTATPTTPATPLPTMTATPPPEDRTPPTPSPTPTKRPRLKSCTRINFDITGDEARQGMFLVQEVGGRHLISWDAADGWQDSGWFHDIDITFEDVFVQVLYYSSPGGEPIVMKIVNPAPGTEYGWMSRGMCHALEVGWP